MKESIEELNYSEPHAQNRLSEAFLLLMWASRHIDLGKPLFKKA